jgi:GNAT superfamily N-acetyltransferase
MSFHIRVAISQDKQSAKSIASWYIESAKDRGTGIALRTPEYISQKMHSGDAAVAEIDGKIIGFCYIETFEGKKYVSNSGLIVLPKYRGMGIAKALKNFIFNYGRDKYPDAKIFGITTSDVVMKINSDLGYRPVAFEKLTHDEAFWKGCQSCKNYDILTRTNRKMCLCTGMLSPSKNESPQKNLNLETQPISNNQSN